MPNEPFAPELAAIPQPDTAIANTSTGKPLKRNREHALPSPNAIAWTIPDLQAMGGPGKKRNRERALPSPHAIAWTIPDYQAMGGPGRTKIYELAKQGKLKLVTIAGRTMVDGDSGRALLRGDQ